MKIAVVGSGAWGTALALRLLENGHDVTLWVRSEEKAQVMAHSRINPRLPQVKLPQALHISARYDCVAECPLVVIATPSFPIREVCRCIAPYLHRDALLVSVTKGLEADTQKRMSEVIGEETHRKVVVLTGPSHAEEVAQGLPTGCLAACADKAAAQLVQEAFMSGSFRVYTSPDPVGAELGGALKNVIALCSGVTDGLGYGDNTKAMLMTRGLTEIARLGVALGAQKDTLAGLAGVGDLIVTCTSMHSRNRRAGILIGQGKTPQQAMQEVGAVVEGYYATRSAWILGRQQGVDMPIVGAAYAVLYEGAAADEVVRKLLTRGKKAELEDARWM